MYERWILEPVASPRPRTTATRDPYPLASLGAGRLVPLGHTRTRATFWVISLNVVHVLF